MKFMATNSIFGYTYGDVFEVDDNDHDELIEAALIGGHIVEVDEHDDPARDLNDPLRPNHSDSKADWVAYAVTRGVDQTIAEGLTKDELIAQLTS